MYSFADMLAHRQTDRHAQRHAHHNAPRDFHKCTINDGLFSAPPCQLFTVVTFWGAGVYFMADLYATKSGD